MRRDEPGFETIGVGTLRAEVHFFKFFNINFTSAIVKPKSYIHASSTPRPRSVFNAAENSSWCSSIMRIMASSWALRHAIGRVTPD